MRLCCAVSCVLWCVLWAVGAVELGQENDGSAKGKSTRRKVRPLSSDAHCFLTLSLCVYQSFPAHNREIARYEREIVECDKEKATAEQNYRLTLKQLQEKTQVLCCCCVVQRLFACVIGC